MKDLKGKIVVITGAGSGIGRALAIQMAQHGAKLALCDIQQKALLETLKIVTDYQTPCLAETVDVSDHTAMQQFARKTAATLGEADILINNAGVALSADFPSMSRSDLEWLFSINFWGVVHGCQAFLDQLSHRSEAQIVNIASVFGLVGIGGQSAYCASKFAIRGFSESLRAEFRSTNIDVMTVYPGGVNTNIVANGRHYQDHLGQVIDPSQLAERFSRQTLTSPEKASAKIIQAIKRKKPRLMIGADARLLDLCSRLSPIRFSQILNSFLNRMFAQYPSHQTTNEQIRDKSCPISNTANQ